MSRTAIDCNSRFHDEVQNSWSSFQDQAEYSVTLISAIIQVKHFGACWDLRSNSVERSEMTSLVKIKVGSCFLKSGIAYSLASERNLKLLISDYEMAAQKNRPYCFWYSNYTTTIWIVGKWKPNQIDRGQFHLSERYSFYR